MLMFAALRARLLAIARARAIWRRCFAIRCRQRGYGMMPGRAAQRAERAAQCAPALRRSYNAYGRRRCALRASAACCCADGQRAASVAAVRRHVHRTSHHACWRAERLRNATPSSGTAPIYTLYKMSMAARSAPALCYMPERHKTQRSPVPPAIASRCYGDASALWCRRVRWRKIRIIRSF